MKNKKSLLLGSIVAIIAILTAIIFFSTTSDSQNSYEYELSEKYGSFDMEEVVSYIGDGMYAIVSDGEFYTLYSRYAKKAILKNGIQYVFEDGVLYFYSDDGYATVYPESNLCKVYLVPQEQKTEKVEFSEEYPLNKLVIYLDFFDEFTRDEQRMLNHLLYNSHSA